MTDFVLQAKSRDNAGKGASRRLRRLANEIPAIIYGGKAEPQPISILHKDITKQIENEAFFSHIISLDVDGKTQEVIIKDLQRHPSKPFILHADFLRVSKTQKLHTKVPLHFINEEGAKGVKLQGGSISHSMTELDITCLPADLPEFIEVDMAEVEVDQIVHISDLTLPKGVESVALAHGDLPVAAIHVNKRAAAEEAAEAGENNTESESTDES